MTHAFFDNPTFREYARLLFELHLLIAQEQDEGEDGERLRDQMDVLSRRLSQPEIEALSELSEDFYSISDPPNHWVPTTEDCAWKGDAQILRSQRRFLEAFGLLRKFAPSIDSAELALQRGRLWEQLNEPRIARAFYDHARKLVPTKP